MSQDNGPKKVECTECRFSRVVNLDGEKLPGDVVREHGEETGHKLRVSPVEELPAEEPPAED